MGYKVKKILNNTVVVLELHGNVSGADSLKVSRRLETLSNKKFERVVVDLSQIEYIDSSWLGIFIYTWKLFNERKKQLLFLIPPGYVLDIFTSARLDATLTIIDSLDKL